MSHSDSCARLRVSWQLTLWVCLSMVLVASLPGCKGCLGFDPVAEREKKKKEAEEEAEKKKKKPKPDFEVLELQVITSDADALQNLIKPGHWVSASQVMRANNFDFSADLESGTVSQQGDPIELEHAPFGLRMSRPLSLPKGQAKAPEMYFYVPRRVGLTSKAPWLESKLRARSGGREVAGTMKPTIAMPAYQYHLMVLAREPDRYGYLKAAYMHSVRVPCDSFDEDSLLLYRVSLPKIDKVAPVPSHPLTWTSIAYVIWDDLDTTVLSPDQQQAMLDWLHWGGQLIVSGPNSLNRLRNSFLADYLPADETNAVDLSDEAFQELNDNFTVAIETSKERPRAPLEAPAGKAIIGAELQLKPGAAWVPNTGELLAERQVGQGRIVVTAFPLTDRNVVNWPSFDSFFNACIFRRPARIYSQGNNQMLSLGWREFQGTLLRDPRLVSSVRFFSRDIDHPAGKASQANEARERDVERTSAQAAAGGGGVLSGMGGGVPGMMPDYAGYEQAPLFTSIHPDTDDYHFGGYLGRTQSGIGGWTDFSGASHLARSSLQEAAGIDVPQSSFVLKVMAVYLLVLVPVNWGIFKLLGRVEWAWIAAPVIAIVGAVAVVRMAQLDIGFARSRTEIAVLETHGGYHRGHLTRYTALYTSLSSNYTLAFEDPSALAAPFAVNPDYVRLRGQEVVPVYFERGRDIRLRGFPVQSNSTNMVHSEQMYNLGDGVRLVGDGAILKLFNGSELPVRGAGVYRRNEAGLVEAAWIGDLPPKTAKTLDFYVMGNVPERFDQWDESPTTALPAPRGEVSLARLIDLSVERLRLRKGDVRLIGWTDAEPKGLDIQPRASQQVFRTLVISHLQRAPLAEPRPDANHPKDVIAAGARAPLTDADLMEGEAGADPGKIFEQ